MVSSRARSFGSITGATASTRSSRLRPMMSAEPMYQRARAPLPKL